MSFAAALAALDWRELRAQRQTATREQAAAVLRRETIGDGDLPSLFAPAADDLLEEMATRAAAITAHRFGRVIQLYAPLYVSNACVNDCVYCGFGRSRRVERRTLTVDEALHEAEALCAEGFRHILLVSGEAPRAFSVGDLGAVAAKIAGRFSGVGIEVFPMDVDEYRRLERAGVDSLTLYQETYDRELYATLHRGPKADFDKRLGAIEAGGEAGFRTLGIGALLGLADWRDEALALALHGRWLARRFWQSRIAVSFPRLRPAAGGYEPALPVSDRDLVHMLVGLRLAIPDAEIVISTRERAELRDRLIPLGVTRMSAGSRTTVGGYAAHSDSGGQFDVHDGRPPAEVARAIAAAGKEPVWKDFDAALRS
jgi:2-iminoacetate synthase